jgi:diguanylate cyclase (GGDEF)-like protein/PAS domain S-box-containing protein
MKKARTPGRSTSDSLGLNALLASVGDGLITYDENGTIQAFEGAASAIFGYTAEEIIGSSVQRLMPAGLRAAHDREMKRYLSGGQAQIIGKRYLEFPGLNKDGTTFRLELAIAESTITPKRLFVAVVRDISVRKQAQAALSAKKERLRVMRGSIGDAVITADVSGHLTYMNSVAEAMTGWRCVEALGRPVASILRLQSSPGTDDDPSAMLSQDPEVTSAASEAVLVHRGGERFVVRKSAARLRDKDGHGIGMALVFRDVTQARQLADMVAHQVARDPVTGMVNRLEFERRLNSALLSSRAEPRDCSVLFLDLDQFKLVNDGAGSEGGDEMLRALAGMLRPKLRMGDTLARVGGDEFAVLLDSCPAEPALRIASMLRQLVRAFKFVFQGKTYPIKVSVGVVTFCNEGLSAGDVIRLADAACYEAKAMGGNQVHVYAKEIPK